MCMVSLIFQVDILHSDKKSFTLIHTFSYVGGVLRFSKGYPALSRKSFQKEFHSRRGFVHTNPRFVGIHIHTYMFFRQDAALCFQVAALNLAHQPYIMIQLCHIPTEKDPSFRNTNTQRYTNNTHTCSQHTYIQTRMIFLYSDYKDLYADTRCMNSGKKSHQFWHESQALPFCIVRAKSVGVRGDILLLGFVGIFCIRRKSAIFFLDCEG